VVLDELRVALHQRQRRLDLPRVIFTLVSPGFEALACRLLGDRTLVGVRPPYPYQRGKGAVRFSKAEWRSSWRSERGTERTASRHNELVARNSALVVITMG